MTDLIAPLRENLPGYTRTRNELDQIKAEMTRRRQVGASQSPFKAPARAELEALLAAGEPLEGLDQRVASRVLADQAADAAWAALEQMRTLRQTELDAAVTSTDMLPLLGQAMAERVTEAKRLAPFKEIATPEAAARCKRYADSDRLTELLNDTVTLRLEQARVLRANPQEGGKFAILHAIRNPGDVFDDLAIWLRPGYLVHRRERGRQLQITPPWPWPLQSAMATPEFQLWALQNGAQLWIPTLAEFETAAKELRRAAVQPRTDDGRHGDDWRDPGPAQDAPSRHLSRR